MLRVRRLRRQDRRRGLGAAMWRGALPPASVWPAAALRVGGDERAREASTCHWSAAGVGKTGGACLGQPCEGARYRERRYGQRRLFVLGGAGGRGRGQELSGPSPALARPECVDGAGRLPPMGDRWRPIAREMDESRTHGRGRNGGASRASRGHEQAALAARERRQCAGKRGQKTATKKST